jgi:MOSC domain-containing protein YiiM
LKKLGIVKDTFSANKNHSGLPRPKVEQLECIKDFGIKDDKFANKNLDRTVMIVGQIAYDIAKENNIQLKNGSLGENILLDFDPHILNKDNIISIGDVKLQLTYECSICNHLSCFDSKLPKLVENHRGLYCKILTNGIIKNNQEVFIL